VSENTSNVGEVESANIAPGLYKESVDGKLIFNESELTESLKFVVESENIPLGVDKVSVIIELNCDVSEMEILFESRAVFLFDGIERVVSDNIDLVESLWACKVSAKIINPKINKNNFKQIFILFGKDFANFIPLE